MNSTIAAAVTSVVLSILESLSGRCVDLEAATLAEAAAAQRAVGSDSSPRRAPA